MKRKITKFGPLQLGKMLGALYAAMSLLFVPFFILFSMIGAMAPQQSGQEMPQGFIVGFGFALIFIAPLFYGLMGFITGLIGAFVYNLIAKKIGGIEVEVE